MKYSLVFVFTLLISPLHPLLAKSEKDTFIESAGQFQRWCKDQSYRHFRKKQQRAYNWSASTIRQLNDYQTTGSWKVDNIETTVFCQIRIGRKAKYTKIEVR